MYRRLGLVCRALGPTTAGALLKDPRHKAKHFARVFGTLPLYVFFFALSSYMLGGRETEKMRAAAWVTSPLYHCCSSLTHRRAFAHTSPVPPAPQSIRLPQLYAHACSFGCRCSTVLGYHSVFPAPVLFNVPTPSSAVPPGLKLSFSSTSRLHATNPTPTHSTHTPTQSHSDTDSSRPAPSPPPSAASFPPP